MYDTNVLHVHMNVKDLSQGTAVSVVFRLLEKDDRCFQGTLLYTH